jgi:secreted trypsin-like serine protease
MNKRLVAFVSIISLLISLPVFPAHSIENGIDAPKDGRAVQLYYYNNNNNNKHYDKQCSGFLYSERIVFTAAHCANGPVNNKIMADYAFVGYPDDISYFNSPNISVEKYFLPSNFEWLGNGRSLPSNDFAIYILSKPMAISGKTIIASADKIKEYYDNKTPIRIIGYGKQDQRKTDTYRATPQFAEFPFASESDVNELVKIFQKNGFGKNGWTLHVLVKTGGPNLCDGDSGAGFYVKNEGNFIYIGANSGGLGGGLTCTGEPLIGEYMYFGMNPAYKYLDLIQEAENYVKSHPVKKTTITCKKSLLSKKVTGTNPKCPTGYKVKA